MLPTCPAASIQRSSGNASTASWKGSKRMLLRVLHLLPVYPSASVPLVVFLATFFCCPDFDVGFDVGAALGAD